MIAKTGLRRSEKVTEGHIPFIFRYYSIHISLPEDKTEFFVLLDRSTDAEKLKEYLLQMLRNIEHSLKQSRKHANQMIRNATGYIYQHLSEDLALETIADAVNTNPLYLSRILSRECGKTITEHITRARIEKAKELLRLSDYFVYPVSETTGFHAPVYFSTIFKKYTGLSPKKYKRSNTR